MHLYSFLSPYIVQVFLRSFLSIVHAVWRYWHYVLYDRYRPTLYFGEPMASSNVTVHDQEVLQVLTMREFFLSRCPSLAEGFHASWMLFNGHLQTVYNIFGDFSNVDEVVYDRKLLRLMDGGTVSLDFTPVSDMQSLANDTPILVAFHGMTGGQPFIRRRSYEAYLRSILAPACASVAEGGLGYRAVVINFRGCAGTPVTSDQLYHCGTTDDARQALMYIAKCYPHARLIGVGFSLGANMLVRYLAQEGEYSRLVAGLGIYMLLVRGYQKAHGMEQVYSRALAQNLQNLVTTHSDKLARNAAFAQVMPTILSLKSPSLFEFDALYTSQHASHAAPFPFPSVREYYSWASSHNVLSDVRVPLLAINADDDPIVQDLPLDLGRNGLVVLAVTRGGGHLGWFTSRKRWWCGEHPRWVRKPVLEWLRAVGKDLWVDSPRGRPLCTVNGFISEVGRENIGCREVEGGGKITCDVVRAQSFAGL
ncbi:hypothetical protein A0H81_03497 [Grifola frondosa]|uniref:AB hydrolase-1 domain-containing protein n=1 Tax=Grifola frondosa TaxID=5627 RepID=A0A1C7MI52_GRIFR|nr:hypothetical protein A0H81_03497 [Grifola frondosa]